MRRLKSLALALALLAWPTLASAQLVAGTVNAKQTGTWNVTNISGTVSLPTGAATEASLVKLPLAQGSTTSGQSGPLIQGAVTTAAPSYTTAQTSPLSLTTGGLLRVDASGVTVPTTQGAVGSLTTNQQAVTATAAALPTNTAKRVCMKVLTGGTQTVYFGATGVTTGTGQELSPGDAWCAPISNTNLIYVIAASTGSTVAFDWIN
jgi:hypothetical protein